MIVLSLNKRTVHSFLLPFVSLVLYAAKYLDHISASFVNTTRIIYIYFLRLCVYWAKQNIVHLVQINFSCFFFHNQNSFCFTIVTISFANFLPSLHKFSEHNQLLMFVETLLTFLTRFSNVRRQKKTRKLFYYLDLKSYLLFRTPFYFIFFLKHLIGTESRVLEFDWLVTRNTAEQLFVIRTPSYGQLTRVKNVARRTSPWKFCSHIWNQLLTVVNMKARSSSGIKGLVVLQTASIHSL